MRRIKFVVIAAIASVGGGCQYLGPIAIDQGRDRYNSVLELTSKEQAFTNIIRVYNHEPTAFMDVIEVDTTTTFSGSVSGAVTNIGARAGTSGGTLAGQTGSVASGVTYSESPLIRYQPLLGQALVAQLATPVSPDVITSLYDSNWGVAPVLDLSAAYLTPDYDESFAALNIMDELDRQGALELVAEKSEVTKSKDTTASGTIGSSGNVTLEVTNKSSTGGGTDALVLYFLSYHPHAKNQISAKDLEKRDLWWRLRRIYEGTQVDLCASNMARSGLRANIRASDSSNPAAQATAAAAKAAADAARAAADAAEAAANAARAEATRYGPPQPSTARRTPNAPAKPPECTPRYDYIELRTMPVTPSKVKQELRTGAPLMRTRSALGILKSATEPPFPRIAFVDRNHFDSIRSHGWNSSEIDVEANFYVLSPEEDTDDPKLKTKDEARIIASWLKKYETERLPSVYWKPFMSDDEFVKLNQVLGYLRRYVLVIKSDAAPPANAYVAHFDHGLWYYIDGDDVISQKNFGLISTFMTMMAVPSTTQPLAPTISVGGG